MARITFDVSDETHARFKSAVAASGKKMADVLRWFVDQYVPPPDEEDYFTALQKVIGAIDGQEYLKPAIDEARALLKRGGGR